MEDELYHHGIKGMRWGVRRKSKTSSGSKQKAKTKGWSKDAKNANRISKKKVNQMTNAELKQLNERKNLEQNYKRLNPSAINKGSKYVATAVGAMGTVLTVYNNSDKLIKAGKNIASKLIK